MSERDFSWPAQTEEGKATLAWELMRHIKVDFDEDEWHGIQIDFYGSSVSDVPRNMTERVFAPLFDFSQNASAKTATSCTSLSATSAVSNGSRLTPIRGST
jgi:hypothetical protein